MPTPSSDSLFCPIRQRWVAALPEEKVRQALVQQMIQCLGYPLSHLTLEKSLQQLPHLSTQPSLPKRRIDLLVFGKDLHPNFPLYPLLLIECKSIPLTHKMLRQIIGYNQFVGAYFIAAVNQTTAYLGYYQPSQQDFSFQQTIPPYDFLLQWAQSFNRFARTPFT